MLSVRLRPAQETVFFVLAWEWVELKRSDPTNIRTSLISSVYFNMFSSLTHFTLVRWTKQFLSFFPLLFCLVFFSCRHHFYFTLSLILNRLQLLLCSRHNDCFSPLLCCLVLLCVRPFILCMLGCVVDDSSFVHRFKATLILYFQFFSLSLASFFFYRVQGN